MTAVLASPVVELAHAQQHDIEKALGDFMEGVASSSASDSSSGGSEPRPKSYMVDPFQLLDSLGMGYRNSPSYITYETLRVMSERDTAVSAVHILRLSQVEGFLRPQENPYSIGFKFKLRGGDPHRRLSKSEKERVQYLTRFLESTGVDTNLSRDPLVTFIKKFVRDRLTYDQAVFEKKRTRAGKPHAFYAQDSATFRIAPPRDEKGRPMTASQTRDAVRFAQVINGQVVEEYTHDDLAFCVANPRSNIKIYGYGMPEPEILLTTVTSHLYAEDWNKRAFSQGSHIPGVLNLRGQIPVDKFEGFKRDWQARIAGIVNAHRLAITNTDGVEFTPMQLSNNEMGYQMWMEYLIKITCAIYLCDPAEINFDLRGAAGSAPAFMTTNEAQQKMSKDRGLAPLLRFIEDNLNRHVIHQIDPRFDLRFAGLDAQTEAQAIELRTKQASSIYTVNELRALEDLPPVEYGDVIPNPVFVNYKLQKEGQQQSQQMMGGGAGGPPGMPPGGAGGPQPPQQGGFTQKPGQAEQDAAGQLHRFADKSSSGSSDSGTLSRSKEQLFARDWQSSIHSSIRGGDLMKSIEEELVYDELDAEDPWR